MTWFWLSLGAAISLSCTDLFAKRALQGLPVVAVAWVRFAFPLPVIAVAVAAWGWTPPAERFWPVVAAAVPLEILATLLYQKALQLSPLSVTAPYLAFTPAFLTVTGRWILAEVPSSQAFVGIALVTVGGYAIHLAPGMGPLGPLRALLRERGSVLMLGVALIYSVTSALGKLAVLRSSPQTFAQVYYLILAVILAPWALRAVRRLPRYQLARALPVGLGGASMILFHYTAIQLVPVSYMISVKRTSLLWSILLGWYALGEKNLGYKVVGGILMLSGVLVLAGSH